MNPDGLVYLLNQAGIAMSQANTLIEQQRTEIERLTAENAALQTGTPDA